MHSDRVELYNGLGYVAFIDAHGSDERIIEAARMSTEGRFKGWGPTANGGPGDEKLLRYLWKNKHATPFEMAHLVFEVQAPVFVVRQVMRHRLFSYNELSARYTEMPDTAWSPEASQIRGQNVVGNKQGSDSPVSPEAAERFIRRQRDHYRASFALYQESLADGIAREQARSVIPIGVMTRFRMGGNLRMWLDFLSKRLPENAQAETREMTIPLTEFIQERHPRTFGLFVETLLK